MTNSKYFSKKEFLMDEKNLGENILSSAPLCIKIFNKDLQLVFINSWGAKEHSIENQEQFDSFDYFSTIAESDRKKIKEAASSAFMGKIQYAEFEHVPGKSSQQWCFSAAAPFSDSKYILISSLDFSEYIETELALQKERRMFKLLLDATPLCIKWFDKNGKLLSVNKAGRKEHFLEDKDEEQIKNWDYMSCIDEKYHDIVKAKFAEALSNKDGEFFTIEHTPGTSTGEWCRSRIAPARNENNEIEMILFISQDITPEKKASDAEKRRVEELETMNNLMIGRELKMVELKKEIEKLKKEAEK